MSANPEPTPAMRYPLRPQPGYPHPDAGLRARQRTREQRYGRKRRRHPVRRSVIAVFTAMVVLVLLALGDRVANAVAENNIADRIQSAGFPVRPSVTITGFPFLTQVAARDVRQVDISAGNIPAGPVKLSSLQVTATGVRLDPSLSGGTVTQASASAVVTFASLASGVASGSGANGSGTAVTVVAAGPDKVAISAGGVRLGDAEVSVTGANEVSVRPVTGGGAVGGTLNVGGTSFGGFTFTIPKLPAGLRLNGASVTASGLQVTASAHDTQLSQ